MALCRRIQLSLGQRPWEDANRFREEGVAPTIGECVHPAFTNQTTGILAIIVGILHDFGKFGRDFKIGHWNYYELVAVYQPTKAP